MYLIITVLIVLVILLINEYLWRKQKIHGELGRKSVHILVGSFVAFWPFYLSWGNIEFISFSFLLVVLISKKTHFFEAIHSVQRSTWGELFFAVSVGLIAFVTADKWIYMVAILQMSLADGLAAVIGTNYKLGLKYQVFGHAKSILGSLTFLIVSLLILVAYAHFAPHQSFKMIYILYALAATILENIAVAGLDNLIIPVFIASILKP
jgi:dolichol kinase